MAIVKTCCCCASLKIGTYGIGVHFILRGLITFFPMAQDRSLFLYVAMFVHGTTFLVVGGLAVFGALKSNAAVLKSAAVISLVSILTGMIHAWSLMLKLKIPDDTDPYDYDSYSDEREDYEDEKRLLVRIQMITFLMFNFVLIPIAVYCAIILWSYGQVCAEEVVTETAPKENEMKQELYFH